MIGGLVLAAGSGSRFGPSGSKLVAPLGGRPLLEHAVRAQCAVPALVRVVVVLGAYASEVMAAVAFGRAEVVICDRWREGQSASLLWGVAALEGATKVIVTLGDEPMLSDSVIARFVDEPGGTRATWSGRPGHPVVLGPVQLRAVQRLRGDHGAGELLRGGPTIECGELGDLGRDVDTVDDLEAIRDEARAVL